MENIESILIEIAGNENITITEKQSKQFQTYFELLLEWNNKINLTSITESVKIVEKHFLDSIMLLKYISFGKVNLVDVGTGAGFPGVPLKIMCPDLELTLMDSLKKRLIFLDTLCEALEIEAETVHFRAEDAGRDLVYRESFDYVTARAVASLNVLSEYCLPLAKKNGKFLAMKGPNLEEELANSKKAIAALGGRTEKVEKFSLPCGDERTLVIIEKREKTHFKYPRHSSIIAKKPL